MTMESSAHRLFHVPELLGQVVSYLSISDACYIRRVNQYAEHLIDNTRNLLWHEISLEQENGQEPKTVSICTPVFTKLRSAKFIDMHDEDLKRIGQKRHLEFFSMHPVVGRAVDVNIFDSLPFTLPAVTKLTLKLTFAFVIPFRSSPQAANRVASIGASQEVTISKEITLEDEKGVRVDAMLKACRDEAYKMEVAEEYATIWIFRCQELDLSSDYKSCVLDMQIRGCLASEAVKYRW